MSADNKEKQDLMDFILDYYENPRNSGSIDDPDVEQGKCDILQKGGNPGCGDIITICLKVEDKIIKTLENKTEKIELEEEPKVKKDKKKDKKSQLDLSL